MTNEKFQQSPEILALTKEKQRIENKINGLQKKLENPNLIEKEAIEFVKDKVRKYVLNFIDIRLEKGHSASEGSSCPFQYC